MLHPCDDVVGLVCFDPDSGAPELIDPDSKLMDEIFPAAAALFEEDDIELMRTASVLTMQGSHHLHMPTLLNARDRKRAHVETAAFVTFHANFLPHFCLSGWDEDDEDDLENGDYEDDDDSGYEDEDDDDVMS